jgi:hypothetical protein
MNTFSSKLETNRTVINRYFLLRAAGLACALLLVSLSVQGQQKNQRFHDMAWPQFRGTESNPVGRHVRLAERWSKTENLGVVARDTRARVVIANRDRR